MRNVPLPYTHTRIYSSTEMRCTVKMQSGEVVSTKWSRYKGKTVNTLLFPNTNLWGGSDNITGETDEGVLHWKVFMWTVLLKWAFKGTWFSCWSCIFHVTFYRWHVLAFYRELFYFWRSYTVHCSLIIKLDLSVGLISECVFVATIWSTLIFIFLLLTHSTFGFFCQCYFVSYWHRQTRSLNKNMSVCLWVV